MLLSEYLSSFHTECFDCRNLFEDKIIMVFTRISLVIFSILTYMRIIGSIYNKYPVPFNKLATCQEFNIESKSCQHYFPVKSIKNYKTNEFKLQMRFYVMATNDANIVLTNGLESGKGRIAYTIGKL